MAWAPGCTWDCSSCRRVPGCACAHGRPSVSGRQRSLSTTQLADSGRAFEKASRDDARNCRASCTSGRGSGSSRAALARRAYEAPNVATCTHNLQRGLQPRSTLQSCSTDSRPAHLALVALVCVWLWARGAPGGGLPVQEGQQGLQQLAPQRCPVLLLQRGALAQHLRGAAWGEHTQQPAQGRLWHARWPSLRAVATQGLVPGAAVWAGPLPRGRRCSRTRQPCSGTTACRLHLCGGDTHELDLLPAEDGRQRRQPHATQQLCEDSLRSLAMSTATSTRVHGDPLGRHNPAKQGPALPGRLVSPCAGLQQLQDMPWHQAHLLH